MLDAQDIDALLIGALYGELTPADEARLAAHLDSHPTDRTALDDLTHARSVVRESRLFQVQLEPPQAISALLLQEAARRAPRKAMREEAEQESWFHRFLHSFMSHPAMAAAAMLVLVVGVASTLYLKKGDHFANQSAPADQSEVAPSVAQDRAAAMEAPSDQWRTKDGHGDAITAPAAPVVAGAMAGSGSAFGADLAERKGGERDDSQRQLGFATQADDKLKAKAEPRPTTATDGKDARAQVAHNAPRHEGVVVQPPPALAPRELPEAKTPAPAKVAVDESSKQEIAGHRPGAATAGAAASPPPPPTQQTAPSSTIARERTADKPADPAAGEASSLLAWAKDQHVRVQALVKAGKCQDAAQLALDISARAPDYYAQYVATDRAIKPCASYINDARDKEAEKSQKARAAKRVNANEPAPAQLDSK